MDMLKAKDVKKAQMKAMEDTFRDVRDMVLLSPSKVPATEENAMRLGLRKQGIRLMLVKNALARRVFEDMGIHLEGCWGGPTMIAWGGTSVAGLSKEIEKAFKDKKTVEFKGAVADGQQVTFEVALKMPTREEAIGRVVTLAMSPGANLAGGIIGPAAMLASQIKDGIKKKAEESGDSTAA